MIVRELTEEEFKNFTKNYILTSPYQTTNYARAKQQDKYEYFYLGILENDNLVGATLILIKKDKGFKYAVIPRGPFLDFNNFELVKAFTQGLKDFLKKLNVIAVKINPLIERSFYDIKTLVQTDNTNYQNMKNILLQNGYYHLGYNNYFESIRPRYEAILDMNDSLSNIFYNFNKETKTKIRSSINKGVEIVKGNAKDLETFYRLIKNKYPKNLEYIDNLYHSFKDEEMIDLYYAKLNIHKYLIYAQNNYNKYSNIANNYNEIITKDSHSASPNIINKKIKNDKLLEIANKHLKTANSYAATYKEDVIIASILLVKQQDTISILLDATDNKFKSFNAKHLLIWSLISKYQNLGFKKFNLGGCANPELENNKYAGLNQFKTNFNAKIYEYSGDYELIINKAMYFMYKNTLKKTK